MYTEPDFWRDIDRICDYPLVDGVDSTLAVDEAKQAVVADMERRGLVWTDTLDGATVAALTEAGRSHLEAFYRAPR